MSHARIEEVSDSDSDPSEGHISDLNDEEFDERDILRRKGTAIQPIHDPERILPPKLSSVTSKHAPAIPAASQLPPRPIPAPATQARTPHSQRVVPDYGGTQFQNLEDNSKYKDFQCVYPIYFDASRSRGQGRMVGLENAVANPLAMDIINACNRLRLETCFEATKFHPKDWSNPGRIRVKVKGSNNPNIKNKHDLYLQISKYLKANPTTTESALRLSRFPGVQLPDPSKPYPEPAIPRGWKMNKILPCYSHAIGGGVSDNMLRDMMNEMGGQMPAGLDPSMFDAPPETKPESKRSQKPKRKIIRA